MSKELTDKWRNGTLENDYYYVHIKVDEHSEYDDIDRIDVLTRNFEIHWDYYIKEVLAPVPTYEEWKAAYECQLMESEEVLTLKHQLKEAKKILYDVWDCRGSREFYAEKAKEYFEKWGVK